MKKEYKGILKLSSSGEADDILFLCDSDDPLAERIKDDIEEYGSFLTVRYHISDGSMTLEELNENLIKKISGSAEAEYGHAYSECTGYLWTDEEIMVGGHDLLAELSSNIRRFCYLEIEFNSEGGVEC